MKFYTVLLITVAFVVQAYSSDIQKEFTVSPGKKLTLDLQAGGTIDIAGWDKDVVSVSANLGGRDGKYCKVDFNQSEKGVSVESYYDGRKNRSQSTSLRFVVKVPRKFDIDIDSKGGAVSIADVQGRIEGKTMGGELDFHDLKGEIDFVTMGGNVTLKSSNLNGEVKTMGGKVLVEDVTGNVKGHTMGGSVVYRNVTDKTGTGTGDEVNVSSMGGEINVDDAPNGANVSTMGGDIEVLSAAKHVKAKTMGGDIRIGKLDGWVKAETMGGDITVTMVGDPKQEKRDVTLISKGGEITLTVPDGLSMDVDITLAYTRDSWSKSTIESDFPLKQERTDTWDREYGSPRKYIYGTGTIGDGKNKIHIETINGNVRLLKGK